MHWMSFKKIIWPGQEKRKGENVLKQRSKGRSPVVCRSASWTTGKQERHWGANISSKSSSTTKTHLNLDFFWFSFLCSFFFARIHSSSSHDDISSPFSMRISSTVHWLYTAIQPLAFCEGTRLDFVLLLFFSLSFWLSLCCCTAILMFDVRRWRLRLASSLCHARTHTPDSRLPDDPPIRCFSILWKEPLREWLQQAVVWTLLSRQVRFMQIRTRTCSYLQMEKKRKVKTLVWVNEMQPCRLTDRAARQVQPLLLLFIPFLCFDCLTKKFECKFFRASLQAFECSHFLLFFFYLWVDSTIRTKST